MRNLIFTCLIFFVLTACLPESRMQTTYTAVATFEFIGTDFGKDSLYMDSKYGYGFSWDDLAFFHKLTEDKTTHLGGFMLSRLKSTSDPALDSTWRVASGRGYMGSETYIVHYTNPFSSNMPDHDIQFLNEDYGTCVPSGCYVNNTSLVVKTIKERFHLGDRLTLKAVGYLDGKMASSVEMLLADYSAQKDSVVTVWTPFELSKLGTVDRIDFELLSTKEIPLYFCMDNMTATVSLSY